MPHGSLPRLAVQPPAVQDDASCHGGQPWSVGALQPCTEPSPLRLLNSPTARSIEAFLPGTPFQLPPHTGWWSVLGYLGLLPGLLLACRQTRPW